MKPASARVAFCRGDGYSALQMKAVTTEQIRALDRRTIESGTPGFVLMDRAGLAVARCAAKLGRRVLLMAGKGNNGGDAIVAARYLVRFGCEPTLALLCRREELSGDPLAHFQQLGEVPVLENPALDTLTALSPEVVVDGLLGTGLTGRVREPYASAIGFINSHRANGAKVVAIDVPSGLDSDTGEAHGICVRADVTVTMGLPKIGLLRPTAIDWVGRVEVADIGFPPAFVGEIYSDVELITAEEIRSLLPPRRRSTHKGNYGHLLIIAGSEGYTGAPVLTAHAAARAGAGLVTLGVPREVYPIVAANVPPEVMPRPLEQISALSDYDVVALGPGMGQGSATPPQAPDIICNCPRPMVVDADGLNAVARDVSVLKAAKAPLILTPHPGEMARLCGCTAMDVQARRWEIAREFAREHGVTVVLKGAGTVVADPSGRLWVNLTGNPGMAKGGVGDALTGIIGALLAQGLCALDAARAGVFWHGAAGDVAAGRYGERSMLASDLIACLGAVFN
ncbi:MAG: NAD(P)H-hydrate dehydratase [Verrucomicrobiae bacterium]|nr:NAD(P)H-hydrate dehydratase [Verrucomicrobiae bacterium]